MLTEIRSFAVEGGLLYAECGGLMYISDSLETLDGRQHQMLGLLPATTRMSKSLQSLGYREATLLDDSLWGGCGERLRGHEFHYSELVAAPRWQSAYQLSAGLIKGESQEGFQKGNILASYLHLHFASQPAAVQHFVDRLRLCGHASSASAPGTQALAGTKTQ